MLAGVGGKTIAQAQANMSYKEAVQWQAYIAKYGSIAPQRISDHLFDKLEYTSAKIAWSVFRALGNKEVKIEDFIPKTVDDSEEEAEVTTDILSVFNFLKACSKEKKV